MRMITLALSILATISCSAIHEKPEPTPVGWEFDIARDATRDSTVTVVNRCQQGHAFELSTDADGFIGFPESTSLDLSAGASSTVPVRFSAVGLEPGTATGHVIVQCRGCKSEPGCLQDRDVFAAKMTVVGSGERQMAAALPTLPVQCVPRGYDCVGPGWSCLVMFPEEPIGPTLPQFTDAAIALAGQAQVVPGKRPVLRYRFTEAPPAGIESIPLEREVPLTGETAARLGFDSISILPGSYEFDRSIGSLCSVSFDIDVAGARDPQVLENYYLKRWSGVPVANPENPFDHVGLYHNVGVDFVLDGGGGEGDADCARRISDLVSRVQRFASLVEKLRGQPEVGEQAWLAAAIATDALTAGLPAPDAGFGDQGLAIARRQLTPQQYEVLAAPWERLSGLLEGAEQGTVDYAGYQNGVLEIEADLANLETGRDSAAPAWMILSTARHSAYLVHETGGPADSRLRISWWKVAKQDLLGAVSGAKFGVWGATVGGVIFSAVEISDQKASEKVETSSGAYGRDHWASTCRLQRGNALRAFAEPPTPVRAGR